MEDREMRRELGPRPLTDRALKLVERLTKGRVWVARMRRYVHNDLRRDAALEPRVPVVFALAEQDGDFEEYLTLDQDIPGAMALRRDAGGQLVLGRSVGRVCFSAWFCEREATRDKPCSVHIHRCYTAPEVRGKGIYKAGLGFILAGAAGRGIECASIDVAEWNVPSIRAIERCGFDLRGRFLALEPGGRKWRFMSRGLRAYGPMP